MRKMYLKRLPELAECLACVKCFTRVGVFPSFLEKHCLRKGRRNLDCEDRSCLLGKGRIPEPGAVQRSCGAGRESQRWGKGRLLSTALLGVGGFVLKQPLCGQPWGNKGSPFWPLTKWG